MFRLPICCYLQMYDKFPFFAPHPDILPMRRKLGWKFVVQQLKFLPMILEFIPIKNLGLFQYTSVSTITHIQRSKCRPYWAFLDSSFSVYQTAVPMGLFYFLFLFPSVIIFFLSYKSQRDVSLVVI